MEEIPTEEILLMVQNSMKEIMHERKQIHTNIDPKKQMEDASFIFRRFVTKNKQDKIMCHAMSLFWQYLIINVDFVLQCKEKEHEWFRNKVEEKIQ